MTKKEKVKGFIKEHKKEILITGGVIVGSVITGKILGIGRKPKTEMYGLEMRCNSEAFRDGLCELIEWGADKPIEGARVAWDCTKDELVEYFTEYVDMKDKPDDYLYSMVLERINKDNFK